jgi:hypothetical protein
MAHSDKSVAYQFTTVGPNPTAAIRAKARTDGSAMSETFVLDIVSVPTFGEPVQEGRLVAVRRQRG